MLLPCIQSTKTATTNAQTTLTVTITNSNASNCGLSVGLGRFELPTFGPPDRRANQAAPQPAAVGHSTGSARSPIPPEPVR